MYATLRHVYLYTWFIFIYMATRNVLWKTAWLLPLIKHDIVRRVWRYQRGNQNPYIEEEQTKQPQILI
jgi:hypothetical protein